MQSCGELLSFVALLTGREFLHVIERGLLVTAAEARLKGVYCFLSAVLFLA
jgi:hypothetical protein